MATRKQTPSATSAAAGTLIGDLVALVNQQAAAINALTAKLDADPDLTATDFASTLGAMDTISYRGIDTPT